MARPRPLRPPPRPPGPPHRRSPPPHERHLPPRLTQGDPWRNLPPDYGRPETVARFFRRLTHNGLWHRLLAVLAKSAPTHPFRAIEHLICRATRRAARIGGMPLLLLIRKLGLRPALNGPPWLLPDPLLSEMLARTPLPRLEPTRASLAALQSHLKTLEALTRTALGRRHIPRTVRLAWP